ncbi:MAG: HEPN domain-containing protein [Planctomycetota bacterium]|jgi:HEPN domain-containing protein
MKDETRQWLQYAEENLHSARLLLKSGLFNPCLQNTQQAIEKLLKAALIERAVKIKKTHSISELLHMLQNLSIKIDISEDECDLIDSIYLPSKYPVGSILPNFEPDETICQQCLEIAIRVQDSVKVVIQ